MYAQIKKMQRKYCLKKNIYQTSEEYVKMSDLGISLQDLIFGEANLGNYTTAMKQNDNDLNNYTATSNP